ncbi:HTH-type transcriptional activator RhaR [Pelotomaculum schinkii]|uniref:HTH-type transcriptional activator RhaR n=1 Tax=Pelotomaculum schinkii TaxID=78350 RepID=A0A4Y7RHT4_9FIRM|nr:helix-turn-helix transcriptional regulator [Pelotomaculum schinkii]TEB08568.1 HTH-type transcriptional activator RhaR [Pelotomaculum schinkii]
MEYKNINAQLRAIPPPHQPWLSSAMYNYREKLVNWNPICIKNNAVYYQFTTRDTQDDFIGIVPDACVNIIFKCNPNNPAALIWGIHEGWAKIMLEPNTTYFGFKPYSVVGIKNIKARLGDLKNNVLKLEDVFVNSSIIEKIAMKDSMNERIKLFQNYAMSNLIDETYFPDFTEYCAILICLSRGNIKLEDIERETGYSERYCRQNFKRTYGVSIKHYSRIVRFQNALRMVMQEDWQGVPDIVNELGYFDQSHFINEFKGFSMTSPSRFRNIYMNLLYKNRTNKTAINVCNTGAEDYSQAAL